MKRIALETALAFVLATLLLGCVQQRWLAVEPGAYTQVRGTDDISRAAAQEIRNLSVDREAATAILALEDGSQITLTFVARARAAWPEGCPTNILLHRMEVLDVAQSNLTIAGLTLHDPVLMRNCPRAPLEIRLCDDGQIGDGGARRGSCLVFARDQAGSADADVVYLGQWEEAGYTFLRWQEGVSLMVWYGDPAASYCQTHTAAGDEAYRVTCWAKTTSGQQVEWDVTHSDGQATVTIEGKSYQLDRGRLFLLRIRNGAAQVTQLDRDLSAVGLDQDDIIAFASTVPEIVQLAKPTADATDILPPSLPHAEKGYELYSWTAEEGPWRYALVTGTDRLKTATEILADEDIVVESGWVKVTVTGEAALYDLLSRLPAEEQLFWRGAEPLLPQGQAAVQFGLPEKAVIAGVEERCRALDLRLTVEGADSAVEPD